MARAAEEPSTGERATTVLCVGSNSGMASLAAGCLEPASSRIESVTATTVTAAFESTSAE
ncbi:hypothetical protein [Halovenus halobia]|uniref:hypothetical protein n=1 Tax=Halovenus halobia TaxID=3396622 RepID=UPI003F547D8D